jgi:hypothetical protein
MIRKKKDNRDNFEPKVVEQIKKRAAYICSNPGCRLPTLIPEMSTETETKYIGKAAHITAAASYGPRYDPTLTEGERTSAKNGIHLCANCADLIDKNDGRDYPAHKLEEWKMIHDEWLRNQHNHNNAQRREINKYISPYFTRDIIYPFKPEERASGLIIVPTDNSSFPGRSINIKGRIDKTISGSTYWIAISPQASFDYWWPQGECILMKENFWTVEGARLGRVYPDGIADIGRKFEIGLYETLPEAHNLFQEAGGKDVPIQSLSTPVSSSLAERGAFLLWKISVTRIA